MTAKLIATETILRHGLSQSCGFLLLAQAHPLSKHGLIFGCLYNIRTHLFVVLS